ncbi:MAG TPA: BTAD domain-containing putative transcriptional regulator [Streptosporangiaceae bacterium]|nr:BTAD domain-containing putative transcriptional regulator [Streptosporangiaceae bacterium]
MHVGILGPLQVRGDAGQPIELGGLRLRALVIRLALDAGHTISAERLSGDLWPGDGPAATGNALQALVSRLRHAAGPGFVQHRTGGYALALSPGEVDAAEFERLVGVGRAALAAGDAAQGAAVLREALGLWRGPALADVPGAPFAAGPVARLEELRLAATEDRIEADLALGRGAELAPELEELAAEHPLRERLRGQLMRVLYLAGRQGDALNVYQETRELLADQLGVDPSPALSEVHLAILRGSVSLGGRPPGTPHPPLRAERGLGEHPPAAGLASPAQTAAGLEPPAGPASPAQAASLGIPRTGNLPAQLTSFVGRDEELNRVAKLLDEARLVTLTGPGGTGKTRLAIEAAARLDGQAPDGAWFVPLAPVRDAMDVPQAVLAALGVPEATRAADTVWLTVLPPLDRLAEAVASQQLVLVLDNCEHLIGAVADLAGRVLAAAPGVRILATSREPLGVIGETLCPVPALPLPPPDVTVGEAMDYGAVRLLAERAGAVRPGFTVDAAGVGPVVRICRALDGNPLAIELAAARLRSLTAAQVAGRLDDRFALLRSGSRTALPQHQTLRAIVDWSWDLLGDDERTVLRRLAVFSGGASPAAAEAVCALAGDSAQIIDLVAALVDKSLVTATGEADVRYHLLETVRAYAADRLAEAGERDQVQAVHADYFLALAEQAEPQLRGPDQLDWLARLSAEHDNFAAALRYSVSARDAPMALRLVAALSWFWLMRDYETEAGEWATEVRELAGDQVPPGLADAYAVCHVLATMTLLANSSDASPDQLMDTLRTAVAIAGPDTQHSLLRLATPMLAFFGGDTERGLRELRTLDDRADPWVRAAGRAAAGHLALNAGQLDQAATDLAQSHVGFTAIGDRWGLVVSLAGLAEVALARDDPDEAVRLLEEGRAVALSGLHRNFADMMLIKLGQARARQGNTDAARADLERGVHIAERIGEKDDAASGYLELAGLARQLGDPDRARELIRQAMESAETNPGRPGMASIAVTAYSKLGCLDEQQGDLTAAAGWHARAAGLVGEREDVFLSNHPVAATVAEGCAALAAAQGQHHRAAELLGLAHTLHGFRDAASPEVRRVTALSSAVLGAADFDAGYARGQGLTRADLPELAAGT